MALASIALPLAAFAVFGIDAKHYYPEECGFLPKFDDCPIPGTRFTHFMGFCMQIKNACKGKLNNFESLEECENRCLNKHVNPDCQTPDVDGSCDTQIWIQSHGYCKEMTGCPGTGTFASFLECAESCFDLGEEDQTDQEKCSVACDRSSQCPYGYRCEYEHGVCGCMKLDCRGECLRLMCMEGQSCGMMPDGYSCGCSDDECAAECSDIECDIGVSCGKNMIGKCGCMDDNRCKMVCPYRNCPMGFDCEPVDSMGGMCGCTKMDCNNKCSMDEFQGCPHGCGMVHRACGCLPNPHDPCELNNCGQCHTCSPNPKRMCNYDPAKGAIGCMNKPYKCSRIPDCKLEAVVFD